MQKEVRMAKTKISELEKKFGADRKEIIAFLNQQGIDAKTAGSSVDDAAVKLVADKFGKASSAEGRSAKEAPANGATAKDAAAAKETAKEAGAEKPAAEAAPSEGKQTPSDGKSTPSDGKAMPHVVKKKKIIIVTNASKGRQGSSYVSGQGRTGARTGQAAPKRGQRSSQGGRNAIGGATGGYHPIKPKTAPSQMSVDFHKETVTPARKAEPQAEAAKETANIPATEEIRSEAAMQSAAQIGNTNQTADASKVNAAAPVEKTQAAKAETHAKEETTPKAETSAAGTAPAQEEAKPAKPTHYDLSGNTIYTKDGAKKVIRNTNTTPRKGERPNVYRNAANGQRNGRTDRNGQGAQPGRGRFGQGGRPGVGGPAGHGRVVMNDGARDAGRGGRGPAGRGRTGGYNAQAAPAPGFGGRGKWDKTKDKRNRKDAAFAEEDLKEKRGKSGRFIRPTMETKAEPEETIKVITIPEKLTIGDLAEAMHMKSAELIKKLFLAGKMMTQNSEITYEEAENIAADYDILCEKEQTVDMIEELLREDEDDPATLVSRPPVLCVMGHVDHGKTSILDLIRMMASTGKDAADAAKVIQKAKDDRRSSVNAITVADKEAGGITQAIGAYTVKTKSGRVITFLDTPGHEAFTAMRLRGAQSTDIAVLVVAADDGVMPQTIEAINHAKAAGVEIIVAINKMDKPGADPDRVKQQLAQYGLQASDWGGQTECVPVSAKTGDGIEDLLDTILLQADVMELKANPNRLARGIVVEARLDKGRGPVANVLVQKGTLHVGDFVSAGPAYGKVRALINDRGENVKEAGPSMPVMVMGLSDVPSAGEIIVSHASNDEAKSYADTYKEQHKEELVEENRMSMNVEDLFDQMREGKMKELELIVKADVQGSVEALVQSLKKLSNDEVEVKIIHSAVGNITESDVTLAEASNAAIIGFNVHPDATAKSIADHGGVSIHLYKVIYQCIDDVDAALKGMLAPVYEEKVTGHAEVRQMFKAGRIGNIAGCMVLDGIIERDASVRVTRDKDKIFEGSLASLKRFKDDVKEVKAGYDCGMVFEDWDAMNIGDQIEAYKMVEVPREEVERRKAAEANKAAKAAEANA